MGLDVAGVLGGAGALAGKAGKLAQSSKLAKAGSALGRASEFADPFQLVGKGLGLATNKLSGKLAGGLDAASENIVVFLLVLL